jgi:hypothetical protein
MKCGFLFVLLLSLNSCDLIRLLNTSEQNDESTEEINSFLRKRKYKYDYSFENVDSTSDSLARPKYRLNNDRTNYAFIQLRIFKSNGELYSGYSQCMGNFNNRKFIDSLPPTKNTYPYINTELLFENELDLINISPGIKSQIIDKSKKYDYTFVVYWTIWTNYFSEHVLHEVSKMKAEFPDKVLVILVNTAKEKSTISKEQTQK